MKDWRVRIEDILEACHRIDSYIRHMNREEFCADLRTQDAVARNLEIIGEAAHRLPSQVQHQHPEIPWNRMGEMRNLLIHEYHSVDAEIIWYTLRDDLPPLVAPLRALLQEEIELI